MDADTAQPRWRLYTQSVLVISCRYHETGQYTGNHAQPVPNNITNGAASSGESALPFAWISRAWTGSTLPSVVGSALSANSAAPLAEYAVNCPCKTRTSRASLPATARHTSQLRRTASQEQAPHLLRNANARQFGHALRRRDPAPGKRCRCETQAAAPDLQRRKGEGRGWHRASRHVTRPARGWPAARAPPGTSLVQTAWR